MFVCYVKLDILVVIVFLLICDANQKENCDPIVRNCGRLTTGTLRNRNIPQDIFCKLPVVNFPHSAKYLYPSLTVHLYIRVLLSTRSCYGKKAIGCNCCVLVPGNVNIYQIAPTWYICVLIWVILPRCILYWRWVNGPLKAYIMRCLCSRAVWSYNATD